MATKDNSTVMELRAFILTTDFEKAIERLFNDPAFNETVSRRTDDFIRRHGKTQDVDFELLEEEPASSVNESPVPVPSAPKIPGWLTSSFANIIVPDSRQTAGAMAANRAQAGPTDVTRQLEFTQDTCNFWVEVRRTSGRTRVVLCSEAKEMLSLVQAIAFCSDVAAIEHIGNDAVIKIDRIVLDSYIRQLESNEGTVPCPTLIFSRNG